MDKAQAKAVQTEVGEAIKAVYAKHGLTVTGARATYDDASFNLSVKAVSSKVEDASAQWAKYAPVYGLPVQGVGLVITLNREQWRITGLDLNRRSFPVRTENVKTGKVSLFKPEAVRRALQAISINVPA